MISAAEGPDRSRIAGNARQFVEANHDWERIFETLDRDLESVRPRPARERGKSAANQQIEIVDG